MGGNSLPEGPRFSTWEKIILGFAGAIAFGGLFWNAIEAIIAAVSR
jgi:hypothetical protein